MPVRLTPEEREARRKERARRSFSDESYKHYDPTQGGYGRPSDWMRMAEALAEGASFRIDPVTRLSKADRVALATLGLDALPTEVSVLKSAFRKMAFQAHPDQGGTDEQFKIIYAAFERLLEHFRGS